MDQHNLRQPLIEITTWHPVSERQQSPPCPIAPVSAIAQSNRDRALARTMQRPRLSAAMRDNWRHLQRVYGLEVNDDFPPPRRAPSLDSLINSSEGAASSENASAPEDSDSGADTRDPEPMRRKNKKCPQSFSSSSSGHMETIHEETTEPKVSVKEILARFENLKEKSDITQVVLCSVLSFHWNYRFFYIIIKFCGDHYIIRYIECSLNCFFFSL